MVWVFPNAYIPTLFRSIREREGVPPAPALEALAMQVRAARRVELQVRAARAVPRMQLVIATVLVPAVLALVAALVIGRLA